jgi:hypothetical protein
MMIPDELVLVAQQKKVKMEKVYELYSRVLCQTNGGFYQVRHACLCQLREFFVNDRAPCADHATRLD